MASFRSILVSFVTVALVAAAGDIAHADSPHHDWQGYAHGRDRDDDDHDRAWEARARGEVLPLRQILSLTAARVPGRVAEVELENEGGVWTYEIRVISPRGRLIDVHLDARTGKVMKIEDD